MNTVAAGIVVYNPDHNRLIQCINHLEKQVACIIIYDNSTEKESNFDFGDKVVYISNHKNDGVAHALNEIFKKAKSLGYKWLLTMDQDTIVPDDMVETFANFFNEKGVGIICPQVIDKRRVYLKIDDAKDEISNISFCITSASCTNIEIWDKLGGFDEFLFIDFVDNEYCKRLVLNGYKILRCNNIIIDQEFGKIQLKSPYWVKFYTRLSSILNNKNVAKLSYKKEVSPLRVYYVHRNLLYLNKKYKNYGGIGYDNFYCNSFGGFLLYFSLPSFVRASRKLLVLKAILKGLYDGFQSRANVTKYQVI